MPPQNKTENAKTKMNTENQSQSHNQSHNQSKTYDVLVVGAGHAGCEAAVAAAKLGANTLLISMNLSAMGQMSCNPAMGGVAKGQIVREIDALGGQSAYVADQSAIQFRMLNRSKGPAMWSPRTQNDRQLFTQMWNTVVENTPRLWRWQDTVTQLIVEKNRIQGVQTQLGLIFKATTVILTNGTFLNGRIHIGPQQFGGGRLGERSATGLTEQLQQLGFTSARMKTGTPPRIDGRSIQYEAMEEQLGEEPFQPFSYFHKTRLKRKQRSCHMGYTSPAVHALLKKNLSQSPLFNGQITGTGPRYCPSIEDKISRFADKDRHLLFFEPEGWNTHEVYVNGFSTSLPYAIQEQALRQIEGLKHVHLLRPGYAIEYDYFCPTQLHPSLETKHVQGLFFAGQINGTTGYEEAACQGLLAGINAKAYLNGQEPLILARHEAYIGVLIDDLVHKGTQEPYRMFTSRAEHRLSLRQDNAQLRLTHHAVTRGLLPQKCLTQINSLREATAQCTQLLDRTLVTDPLKQARIPASTLLRRPHCTLAELLNQHPALAKALSPFDSKAQTQAEIGIKYAPYLARAEAWIQKKADLDRIHIQANFDYDRVHSLSNEGREKLKNKQPQTLAQAAHISGVSASDVAILNVYLGG